MTLSVKLGLGDRLTLGMLSARSYMGEVLVSYLKTLKVMENFVDDPGSPQDFGQLRALTLNIRLLPRMWQS